MALVSGRLSPSPSGTTALSKIELRYTNDQAAGGDRNLFVDYIEVNGTRLEAESAIYVRPGMTTETPKPNKMERYNA
jgi:hypothetical protein